MTDHESKGVFSLEVTHDNGKIRISAYTKSSDVEKTVRQYEMRDLSDAEIAGMCASVTRLLNRANSRGKLDRSALQELQAAGLLLYDSLLTTHVKNTLAATKSEDLNVIVDDHLVHIPWELLYDGRSFLCRRFNMGRLVRTGQRISGAADRKLQRPLKMLIIADPRNDLEQAYNEGISLRDELDKNLELVEVDLRSSIVDPASVKGSLRDYDALHYAGHADYDMKLPSESGFLMADGKLTASDIMNMTGPAPLPSLVFSNACKSGHTDMWKVREDYETEIFGLANAFLLAGVRHYIGTFWDVRDEPGRYFAMDFYKELTKGAMIGEAVKKARSGLIERYGEDTIIWASYMLYGDPTIRYVDVSWSTETGKESRVTEGTGAENEEEAELAGSVRGANTEIVFPRKKNKWLWTGSVFLVVLAAFVMFSIFSVSKDTPPAKPDNAGQAQEAKNKRIDELVAALIKDYRENQKTGRGAAAGVHKSGPPTLVFLNIKANGITEADKEFIITGITDSLRNSKMAQVVEREILDKLLEELNLSSSQLADPSKVLEVGKILAAQIISTGSISRDGSNWQVSLRFIDTETTSIQAALTKSLETKDKEEVAAVLSNEILNKIRTD